MVIVVRVVIVIPIAENFEFLIVQVLRGSWWIQGVTDVRDS